MRGSCKFCQWGPTLTTFFQALNTFLVDYGERGTFKWRFAGVP